MGEKKKILTFTSKVQPRPLSVHTLAVFAPASLDVSDVTQVVDPVPRSKPLHGDVSVSHVGLFASRWGSAPSWRSDKGFTEPEKMRKEKKTKLQKNKLTFFIGYWGWNVCGQAAGGQRLPLAVCTTGDLLSSIQLETVHAGEVEAVPHPERLPRGAEGVGHRRAGAGGLPLWTNQNRHVYYPHISAYISHTHTLLCLSCSITFRQNWPHELVSKQPNAGDVIVLRWQQSYS